MVNLSQRKQPAKHNQLTEVLTLDITKRRALPPKHQTLMDDRERRELPVRPLPSTLRPGQLSQRNLNPNSLRPLPMPPKVKPKSQYVKPSNKLPQSTQQRPALISSKNDLVHNFSYLDLSGIPHKSKKPPGQGARPLPQPPKKKKALSQDSIENNDSSPSKSKKLLPLVDLTPPQSPPTTNSQVNHSSDQSNSTIPTPTSPPLKGLQSEEFLSKLKQRNKIMEQYST